MRTFAFAIAGFILTASLLLAADDEPLAKLIARADAATDHQAELYARVVQREVSLTSDDFAQGRDADAKTALDAVNLYSDKLLHSAQEHHKRLKETELSLRSAARRLHDLEQNLALEDRPIVKAADQHLQQVDSELLKIMFAPPEKK
jgi:hypothetical protein